MKRFLRSVPRVSRGLAIGIALGATLTVSAAAQSADARVAVTFPLGVGFRLPEYNRVDGLALPFGPTITFGNDRLMIDPRVTYRSHLGKFDPALGITVNVDSMFRFTVTGQRGTFSNDRWIRSDLRNSAWTFLFGHDTRNYYRADRAEARLTLHTVEEEEGSNGSIFVGALMENSWSTGWRVGEQDRWPFSIGRPNDQTNGIARANPEIGGGHIASAILGGQGTYRGSRADVKGELLVESAWHTPSTDKFTQVTLDGVSTIRTIAGQYFGISGHLVTTGGGTTPGQRFAYIGGPATLLTLHTLERGGDRAFLLDTKYVIPIPKVDLPMVGPVGIGPRFVTGAAGVGAFGTPTRNVGVQLSMGLFTLDYLVDPSTHRKALDFSINVGR